MKYLIIAFTLLGGTLCYGQETWKWARSIAAHIDGSGSDRSVEQMSSAVATDREGNVYLAGLFSDSIVQDGFRVFTAPRTQTFTPIDIFVAKFNATGKLLWLRSFDGNFVNSATVDSKNNFYIAGSFGPTMTVGDTMVAGSGYVVKCTPDGEFEWVLTTQTSSGSAPIMGVSAAGNDIYLTGRSTVNAMEVQLGDSTITGAYSFVARIGPDASVAWLKAGDVSYYLMSIAALPGGGCVTCNANYIFRYTEDGVVADQTFVKNGNFNTLASNGSTICVVGTFRDSVVADGIILHGNIQNFTMFMVIYSLDGDLLSFRAGVGNGSNAYGVCVDSMGRYSVTGRYSQSIRFDDVSVDGGGFGSSFLVRFDPDLHASYIYAPPVPHTDIFLGTLAATRDNEVFAAGFYRDTVQFGSHYVNSISGYPDVAIAKLGFTSSVYQAKAPVDDLSLFPVPATDVLHIKMEDASAVSILVYDLFGREVLRSTETTLKIAHLPSGIYKLVLQRENLVRSSAFQIVR